ncbi:MAG: tetratricopeptide repeat protein [Blastocatellia bacterium]|nr:tetratricopeptide repeat protein [Blastocatellia bacterium]
MTRGIRIATALCLACMWLSPAAVCGQVPGQAPASSLQPARPADARARRQAYMRYIEAQRLKSEAQRTRNARLLEDAIRAYKETIELDPTAPEPRVDLGEVYFFFQSRTDLAEREAMEALRLDVKNVGAHLLLARLYIFTSRGEKTPRPLFLDRAMREYEKVAELDPKQAEAWAVLADIYAFKNDTPKQLQALEKWAGAPIPNDTLFYTRVMNADLSSDQAWYRLSTLYLSQNRNREAVDAARRAYEANPESSDYVRNLIGILRVAGTSAEELRAYAQLMKSVGSPSLLIGYGPALIRAGRYAEAIETLREFVQYDPTNASAVGLLAIAQRRGGQRPAAIETLKAGIAKVEAGTRADLVIELGQTYEEIGRNDEAIAQYELAFDSILGRGPVTAVNTPLLGEVVNRLVRVCRRAGNQTKLQSILARTRRAIDEQNPLLDILTIETLREDGRRREALDLAQAAIRRYPEDRALKFTEALLLGELKRHKDAADVLTEMIKGRDEDAIDDAGVLLILASIQAQSGALNDAETSIRKALSLNPGDPETLVQLASVLDRAGKTPEAETILRDLLKREPDNSSALNNLGYLLVERSRDYREALALIQQAVAIDPIQGSFLDSLGWTHHKLGNQEKARETLEKALLYSRRNATIHEHLGDVLQQQGLLADARRQWEKALEYSIEADEIARLKGKLRK